MIEENKKLVLIVLNRHRKRYKNAYFSALNKMQRDKWLECLMIMEVAICAVKKVKT